MELYLKLYLYVRQKSRKLQRPCQMVLIRCLFNKKRLFLKEFTENCWNEQEKELSSLTAAPFYQNKQKG